MQKPSPTLSVVMQRKGKQQVPIVHTSLYCRHALLIVHAFIGVPKKKGLFYSASIFSCGKTSPIMKCNYQDTIKIDRMSKFQQKDRIICLTRSNENQPSYLLWHAKRSRRIIEGTNISKLHQMQSKRLPNKILGIDINYLILKYVCQEGMLLRKIRRVGTLLRTFIRHTNVRPRIDRKKHSYDCGCLLLVKRHNKFWPRIPHWKNRDSSEVL